MLRVALYIFSLSALAISTVPLTTLDAEAQTTFRRPIVVPAPTTGPRTPTTPTSSAPTVIVRPTITITPRTPAVTVTPTPTTPAVTTATPQPTGGTPTSSPPPTAEPVYRDGIPLPIPRPIYVEGVPNPKLRPLLTLDRPALLQAERRPGIIVTLIETGPDKPDASDLARDFGLELLEAETLAMLDVAMVRLRAPSETDVDEIVAAMIADERVFAAQPNYVFALQQAEATQTATLLDLQYAPQRMEIARTHEITRGKDTIIAIIDTGADLAHLAFETAPVEEFNAVGTPSTTPEPHGTAIAGLIAASKDLMGIAPDAKMLLARAFSQTSDAKFLSDSFTIAKAVDWAVANEAQIINMSFAGPADPLVLELMDQLQEKDILVVAAAGNNGIEAPAAYPAAHAHAIAVTATDANDALYVNANRGIYVTVAAPGVDVIAPAPNNSYELTSGTSIATAHMSGIIALMLSKSPELSRDDIVEILNRTALDAGAPGRDPEFGLGLVDAFKAASILPPRSAN